MSTTHNAWTVVGSTSPQRSDAQLFKGVPVTWTPLSLAAMGQVKRLRSKIMGVCVVPVTPDGRIVLTKLRRGVEIPGGGIEPDDRELADTARREAWEEARVELGRLELVQFIRVDRCDVKSPPRYIVIFAGMVTRMPPFERTNESLGRILVTPADYITTPGSGTVEGRRQLVTHALTALARHNRYTSAIAS